MHESNITTGPSQEAVCQDHEQLQPRRAGGYERCLTSSSTTGMLITFFQFLFATCAAYLTQFSTDGRFALKTPRVPVRRWALIAVMFCAVNVLNNWAFAFDVSVPVHIILRSFGSVTTMAAGVIRGKRYSTLQTLSVALLTLGVLVSAWADSEGKVGISASIMGAIAHH